jgi:signal transduction histidine kinase
MKLNASSTTSAVARRTLRWMLVAHAFWLGLVLLLGLWWVSLVLKQADKIRELEVAAGASMAVAFDHWQRTRRMLLWESSTYGLVLLAITGLIAWMYWRDIRRSRGIQAFFASVTHELRTPLTSIRLQAESIAERLFGVETEQWQSDEKVQLETQRLIRRLLEDTMRLEGQVERTLELSRVEGGGAVFPQSFQLKPWLSWLLKSWEDTYGDRVRFENQVGDVWVEADPRALQVILRNLFENSFRHGRTLTASGGLELGSRPVVIRLLSSQAEQRGEKRIELQFCDNGPGYRGDVSQLGRIFQKGPESQGAGVGLYLVRVLMERMGGSARFESVSGFCARLSFRASDLSGVDPATVRSAGHA